MEKDKDQLLAALRESEQRIQQALRLSHSFTFEWQTETDLVLRSASCASILRLSGDEASHDTGQQYFQRVCPEDRPRFMQTLQELKPGADTYVAEYRVTRGDGSIGMLEETGQATFDPSGKLQRLVGVTTDITERKLIDETLRFLVNVSVQPSGEPFFLALARYLAKSLGMDYVCIDQLEDGLLAARTVAVYFDGKFEDNVSYTLKDTPCGDVVGKTVCCFPRGVRHLFAKDTVLQDMLAESYVGVTLWSSEGKPVGLIAVIGRKPLENPSLAESILKLVAIRASGELERLQAERELRENQEELKKLNRTLKALNDSSQAMMRADQEIDYLNEVCRIIVEDCGHAMVWVGFAEQDEVRTVRPVAQAGFEDGYLKTIKVSWADVEHGRGPTGIAIRTGKVSICRNMLTDPDFLPWRAEAKKRGYASSIVFPLSNAGKVFGAITVYSREPDPFSQKEVKLLAELADDVAHGVMSLRWRAEHLKAEEALRSERKLLRTLIDNIPEYIYLKDPQSRFITANKATARIMRCRIPEELLGKTDFDFYPPDLARKYFNDERDVILTGNPKISIEEEVIDENGHRKTVLTSKVPLRNNAGDIVGLIGIGMDITELKRAEDVLKRDKETFERLVDEKTQALVKVQLELERAKRLSDVGALAATIAHELRNPLAAISMAAANIKRKSKDRELLEKHFQTIDKKVLDADQIISNLLFYSRLRKPELKKIDVAQVIAECVDHAERQFRGKIVFKKQIDALSDVLIDADVLQVHETILNLLNNACDAVVVEEGVVEVAALHDEASVKISIKDNGVGISKEDLQQIFDPFFTTKTKGTGLGLTVCDQVIKMHGGSIVFTSEPGKGTLVEVVLPKNKP